ncbi:MAG: GPR endopeptidase [Clostridia bacterium]|nr:GPR endopeptidase [Clostridia bacterium]
MQFRTDLALERREILGESCPRGVRFIEKKNEDARISEIIIENEDGAKALGKPQGKYITIEMNGFPDSASLCDGRLEALSDTIKALLPEKGDVLVAGLGNTAITPDALGPECASMVIATRHIDEKTKRELRLPFLRSVSVITPSVAGKTGIESTEIIASICEKIKPCAVITVDALAATNVSRLARTVQLCNTGIQPGSGVGNARKAVNEKNLGVPVIAIGVPTVVDAVSLAKSISGEIHIDKEIEENYSRMMVAPKDTDIITQSASKLIALAINCVLQPTLSQEEILSLM